MGRSSTPSSLPAPIAATKTCLQPGRRASRPTDRLVTLCLALTFCFLSPTVSLGDEGPPAPVLLGDERSGARLLEQIQEALADLVEETGPSIVAIQANQNPTGLGRNKDWTARPWASTGSGVIIRKDGMILTSQHVIEGAVAIQVVLHDGRRVMARRVAADRRSDLAIIRIKTNDLRPASLRNVEDLRRGHIVIAMGNPLGLSSDGQAAVSHGLISAIGRPLPDSFGDAEDRFYGEMIQTTAPINPGNSGGPLIDVHGQVVGIIAAVSTRADGREGIGFAVPISSHTRAIIEKLLRGQPIEYGYLGVQVDEPSARQRRSAKLKGKEGVLIDSVFPNGPAAAAGLCGGDIVLSVDDTPIRTVEEFIRTIGSAGSGREVEIGFIRGDTRSVLRVGLVSRPSSRNQPLPQASILLRGASLGPVEQGMQAMANLPERSLLVLRVKSGSSADQAGLSPGDVIIQIDGEPLALGSLVRLSASDQEILIGLANGGSVLLKPD